MLTLIGLVIFNLVPFMIIVAILEGTNPPTPSLSEAELDLELQLTRLKEEVAIEDAQQMGFNSIHLLLEEMEVCGVEMAYLFSNTDRPLVVIEDDSVEVDVSEFSDALNPASVDCFKILSINEEDEQASTVVDFPAAETTIFNPMPESTIAEMVADILASDDDFPSLGSDEATFFQPPTWADEWEFSDTLIERENLIQ